MTVMTLTRSQRRQLQKLADAVDRITPKRPVFSNDVRIGSTAFV